MAKTSLAIPINPDIGNQAQLVCKEMGLDIITAIDYFLRQIVHNRAAIPFDAMLAQASETKGKGKPVIYGGWEGKAKIADDFNAPIDDFEEYM